MISEPFVISVPGRELAQIPIPGSIFDAALLNHPSVSPELKLALELLSVNYPSIGKPLMCVARPEIFTHGASLEWLNKRLGSIKDHLCLCDGTSIKLIPQFRNHLFTYGLQCHQRNLDFKRLLRRAPELLTQCQSQFNSFHRFVTEEWALEPSPSLMQPRVPFEGIASWYFGFYLNTHSLEDSAEHMLSWGELQGPKLEDYESISYVPLTESAANNKKFQRIVSEKIAATYFDPSKCLLIRLPSLGSGLTDCMRVALEGIRASSLHLPQVRSKNIFFLGGELPEAFLRQFGSRTSLLLHQSFEFWRYTRSSYVETAQIVVFLDREWKLPSESAKKMLCEAFGRTPQFIVSRSLPEAEWLDG